MWWEPTVLWSLLMMTACFTEPPSAPEPGSSTVTGDTGSSTAETAASADAADTTGAEASSSGSPQTSNSSSSSSGAPSSDTDASDSSTGSTGGEPDVLFDVYDGACLAQWESIIEADVAAASCGLMPMDINEAGGAWLFPTIMTMGGSQERALVLRPHPLETAEIRGTFSAGDVAPGTVGLLEFDYAFVNVVPGGTSVGTMTFHVYVLRPDGATTDILVEESKGDGTAGTVALPIDTVIFGALDNIVFSVRSDVQTEGQAVALWDARVIAET